MCGLYGFLHYGDNKIKDLSNITNALAEEAAIGGTDATGIAFCKDDKVQIIKESKSAYKMNLKHPEDIKTMIGHTRHSTQGSEKKNYNNHPFLGKCQNTYFALAHNGVLINDKDLRKKNKLPKTKIETDSYIAVQLIEDKKELDIKSIKHMAEAVEGSFSFSIMDNQNSIWLVKGDSPLSIIHFPNLKLYVYASTEEILWKALIETSLFGEIKTGNYSEVKIRCGDILNILPDGTLIYDKFEFDEYKGYMYDWRCYSTALFDDAYDESSYIDEMKNVAKMLGIDEEMIDTLIKEGFTIEEIEEYIYC